MKTSWKQRHKKHCFRKHTRTAGMRRNGLEGGSVLLAVFLSIPLPRVGDALGHLACSWTALELCLVPIYGLLGVTESRACSEGKWWHFDKAIHCHWMLAERSPFFTRYCTVRSSQNGFWPAFCKQGEKLHVSLWDTENSFFSCMSCTLQQCREWNSPHSYQLWWWCVAVLLKQWFLTAYEKLYPTLRSWSL